MRSPRSLPAVAAVLVALLVGALVAGCGGDDDAAPTTTAPTPLATTAPASTPASTPPAVPGAGRARRRAVTTVPSATPRPSRPTRRTTTTPGTTAAGTTTTVSVTPPRDEELELPEHTDRPARLHVPALAPGARAPLLLVLHGSYSSAEKMAAYSDLDALADEAGWALLWPEGSVVDGARSWNAGTCCEPASTAGTDDLGYLGALLDDVLASDPIDPARVVVVGHSNGAFMAYTVGCRLADRVAAVVSVAGGLATSCTPSRPLPVLEIHGTGDESVAYAEGTRAAATWRAIDGCDASSTSTTGRITTRTDAGCAPGTEVVLVTLAGAPHAWPGGPEPTVEGFDAGEVLLAWLGGLPGLRPSGQTG